MMESSATVAQRAPAPALDPRRWKALALLLLGPARKAPAEQAQSEELGPTGAGG
jgi:hypothetical protein